eukprot:4798139-Amphidinium_carterae.1
MQFAQQIVLSPGTHGKKKLSIGAKCAVNRCRAVWACQEAIMALWVRSAISRDASAGSPGGCHSAKASHKRASLAGVW